MKPLKKIFTVALGGLTLLSGCNKFEDWNTNPDKTTTPNASMLCSYMIAHVARQNSGYSKTYLSPYFRPKLFIWMEGANADQYNSMDRFSNDNLDINLLANLDDMVTAAEAGGVEGVTNSYKGVRHFIRVYKFLNLTLSMGDIPYSEAIQKDNALYYPKYDTQKDIFLGLLDELDAADRYFANGASFAGDLVYGGNPAQWRKLVNSYQLEVLSHLYKKRDDSDINLSARYTSLISRPLMSSNDDNFQLVFKSGVANQRYPMNSSEVANQYTMYGMHSSVVIDMLKLFEDRRLFCYAEPTGKAVSDGGSVSDYDSYAGGDPGASWANVLNPLYIVEDADKEYSKLNARYFKDAVCEPVFIFSYSDSQFLLAEAKARGFFSTGNSAREYYEEGIRANMHFTKDGTKDEFNHGMPITDEWIETYLQNDHVKLADAMDEQIVQIGQQRYLSLFLRGVNHAYWSWRRLGIPEIPINESTNLYQPSNEYPVRWMYPSSEITYNPDNVQEAIQRQFGSSESCSGLMWILKD